LSSKRIIEYYGHRWEIEEKRKYTRFSKEKQKQIPELLFLK
jgi:hypothetical protein